jgi:hypothetical protein
VRETFLEGAQRKAGREKRKRERDAGAEEDKGGKKGGEGRGRKGGVEGRGVVGELRPIRQSAETGEL